MKRILAPGLAAVLLVGCSRDVPTDLARRNAVASTGSPVKTTSKAYPLAGIVRAIKRDGGQVVIRHEAIPGFMEAMTMPFSVKDRTLLEDLNVGDEVVGSLRVESAGGAVQDYELVDLVVR